MTEQEKWDYLTSLDEELLLGGVTLSEWCSFIVRETDTAFTKGANLATILTAVSAIETYLRAEYSSSGNERLYDLIKQAPVSDELRRDLHTLRRYRNKWVHVDNPQEDQTVLEQPELFEQELEQMAQFAAKVLRQTIYTEQWV